MQITPRELDDGRAWRKAELQSLLLWAQDAKHAYVLAGMDMAKQAFTRFYSGRPTRLDDNDRMAVGNASTSRRAP